MLIDWFTVIAQAINFLVLIWLLKRFLYKPIVSAMDAREQRIAAQLRDAEKQEAEAAAQSANLRAAREEFEQKKQTLLQQAESDADAVRRRLTEEGRQEIEALRAKWQAALRDEQNAFRIELAKGVQREILAIARQVMNDLAGKELEPQIAAAFLRKLQRLDTDERNKLTAIFANTDQPAIIRSAFDLPTSIRTEIEKAVAELRPVTARNTIHYEIAPDLVGGIELAADGRKVSWNIADYLSSLERAARNWPDNKSISYEHSE